MFDFELTEQDMAVISATELGWVAMNRLSTTPSNQG